MLERALPEPCRDPFRREVEEIVADEHADAFGNQQAQHEQREPIDPVRMTSLNPLVNSDPDYLRVHECRDNPDADEHEPERIEPALFPHQPEERGDVLAEANPRVAFTCHRAFSLTSRRSR